MPDKELILKDESLNLDMVRDELGRVPIIGRETDRELFADLPSVGLPPPYRAGVRQSGARELLANDFKSE